MAAEANVLAKLRQNPDTNDPITLKVNMGRNCAQIHMHNHSIPPFPTFILFQLPFKQRPGERDKDDGQQQGQTHPRRWLQ